MLLASGRRFHPMHLRAEASVVPIASGQLCCLQTLHRGVSIATLKAALHSGQQLEVPEVDCSASCSTGNSPALREHCTRQQGLQLPMATAVPLPLGACQRWHSKFQQQRCTMWGVEVRLMWSGVPAGAWPAPPPQSVARWAFRPAAAGSPATCSAPATP